MKTGKKLYKELLSITKVSRTKPLEELTDKEKYAEYVTGIPFGGWRGCTFCFNWVFSEADVCELLEQAENEHKYIEVIDIEDNSLIQDPDRDNVELMLVSSLDFLKYDSPRIVAR